MKIENCHPKIEDRIDLRPCPLLWKRSRSRLSRIPTIDILRLDHEIWLKDLNSKTDKIQWKTGGIIEQLNIQPRQLSPCLEQLCVKLKGRQEEAFREKLRGNLVWLSEATWSIIYTIYTRYCEYLRKHGKYCEFWGSTACIVKKLGQYGYIVNIWGNLLKLFETTW